MDKAPVPKVSYLDFLCSTGDRRYGDKQRFFAIGHTVVFALENAKLQKLRVNTHVLSLYIEEKEFVGTQGKVWYCWWCGKFYCDSAKFFANRATTTSTAIIALFGVACTVQRGQSGAEHLGVYRTIVVYYSSVKLNTLFRNIRTPLRTGCHSEILLFSSAIHISHCHRT